VSAESPLFLTVELTLQVPGEMIRTYGGSEGIRNLGLIESAVAQGQNVHHYGDADLFGIAAAALSFLHINGVDIARISSREVYEMMIQIATKELSKSGLADLLRRRLA
jgi:death on curing protein